MAGLREEILKVIDDIEFEYQGKYGSICPFSENDISVAYNGESWRFDNIEDVMSARVVAGKSLSDIENEIKIG